MSADDEGAAHSSPPKRRFSAHAFAEDRWLQGEDELPAADVPSSASFKRRGRVARPGEFYRPRRDRRPSLVLAMGMAGAAEEQMESGRVVLTDEDGALPPEVLKLLWSEAIAASVLLPGGAADF